MKLADILGWVGSVEILAAFGLNSFQKMKSDSVTFQLLNLSGALFLIINSVAHEAYPFTFINSVWFVISLSALVKMGLRKNRLYFFILVLSPGFLSGQTNELYTKQIQEFDRYVESARNTWLVPGLAIAVVKDNQVIFKKGYGHTGLGTRNAVDSQTLFPCASTTKAMTAVCMGMLVDEGKVKWNDAVVNYLPDFQLYDPFVTREVKIRDLFIHDSGLGDADFLWTSMNIPSDEIIRKMSLVKPSYSIRSGFIYQNLFYLVAGKVIEKVSGLPWEMFIRRRIVCGDVVKYFAGGHRRVSKFILVPPRFLRIGVGNKK